MAKGSLIGQTFAKRFKLVELLGSGGMGEVYVAEHAALGRRYAIKVLHEAVQSDRVIVERFRREAQATSRLNHPNIVEINDFGRTKDDQLYLVMELIDGPSLQDVLTEVAPDRLPILRSLSILAQICRAVGAAHEVGIVHRDLKPENTLLARTAVGNDQVKILDFGLAKMMAEADMTALTKAGDIFGTPAFMSPEQARGEEIDHHTDIYSLGVMGYELMAGRLPFVARSMPYLLMAHQKEIPVPPSNHLAPGAEPIPSDVEQVLLACLHKLPQDRPHSAAELLKVVEPHVKLLRETQTMIVPNLLARLQSEAAPDDDWDEPTASPDAALCQVTIAMPSHAAGQPGSADGEAVQHEWYWSQVVKLSREIGAHLIETRQDPPQLRETLGSLAQIERGVEDVQAEIAVANARVRELDAVMRESMARIRYAVVDLSMERGRLSDHTVEPSQSSDLDFQIASLERRLGELFQQKDGKEADFEQAIQARETRYQNLRAQQSDAEVRLVHLLEQHRSNAYPPEIMQHYDRIAQMLKVLQKRA